MTLAAELLIDLLAAALAYPWLSRQVREVPLLFCLGAVALSAQALIEFVQFGLNGWQ